MIGRARPYLPPHWPRNEPFPWPEWELTCPGCGRFHRNWHFVSGETCRCAWCDWTGYLSHLAGDGGDDESIAKTVRERDAADTGERITLGDLVADIEAAHEAEDGGGA